MTSRRVIGIYNGFQFFFGLLLWLPVFYEYQKRVGLSDAEIFGIQSIYYVAFCLFEIPTGMAADRWGYRRCLRWGALVLVAANLLPVWGPHYSGMLWHFLLVGLARSLISGASSAYLYDYLAHHNAQAQYKEVEGTARAVSLVGKVVCWAGIGVLMQWKLTLPYWLTALSALVSVGFAWALPALPDEVLKKGEKSLEVWGELERNVLVLWRTLRSSPALVWIMAQGVAIFVLARIAQVNLFQPILEAKSFSVASYGVVMSVMTLFEALGSARPAWFRKSMSDLNAVYVLTLVMALTLGVLPWMGTAGVWVSLSVFALATGFSFPIQRQLLNDAIVDSKNRATILSIESLMDRSVCAFVAWVLGSFLSEKALDSFLIGSSVITCFAMAIIWMGLNFQRFRFGFKDLRTKQSF